MNRLAAILLCTLALTGCRGIMAVWSGAERTRQMESICVDVVRSETVKAYLWEQFVAFQEQERKIKAGEKVLSVYEGGALVAGGSGVTALLSRLGIKLKRQIGKESA